MTSTVHTKTTVLLMALACCACTSSPQVRELAKTTASNASIVNTKLTDFSKNTRLIAERRAETAAGLSEEVEFQQANFETFLEGARAAAIIAGQAKKTNFAILIEELQRVAEAVRARQEEAQSQRATVRKEILASQVTISHPKERLATISKKLGVLAKEPSRSEQLSFLKGFFKQVVKDIEEVKNAADEAEKSATARADTANDVSTQPIEGTKTN